MSLPLSVMAPQLYHWKLVSLSQQPFWSRSGCSRSGGWNLVDQERGRFGDRPAKPLSDTGWVALSSILVCSLGHFYIETVLSRCWAGGTWHQALWGPDHRQPRHLIFPKLHHKFLAEPPTLCPQGIYMSLQPMAGDSATVYRMTIMSTWGIVYAKVNAYSHKLFFFAVFDEG